MSVSEMKALYDRGELEIEAGRYAEAASTYARILDLDPDSERAQLGYVRALTLNRQDDDAFAFLEPRNAHLEDAHLLVEFGRLLYNRQRFTEAVDVFQRASEKLPDDGHVLANLGFSLWENGQRPEALRVLQSALPRVEDDSLLAANMGQIFMQLGMWNEAVSSYERYLADFPNDLTRRVNLAYCLKNAGWREEAETVLREVLTVNADFDAATQLLNAILAEDVETTGDDTPVIVPTVGAEVPSLNLDIPRDDAAPASSDFAAPAWDFGDVSVIDGLDDAAVRKRVAKELLDRVQPFLENNDLNGAVAFLEKERANSDAPAEVMNLLGKVLIEQQDYESALSALREATELDPRHPQAHSNLGVLLWQLGEVNEAIDVLRVAIQLDSEDFDALVNLALICHQVGLYDDAVNLYVRYLDQQPEDIAARIELAECYVQLEEISAALQELDTVLLLDPENEKAQARYNELSQQSGA
jgi:tetratricopeptide (TPR) repeat protein